MKAKMSLGDLALQIPGAPRVLRKHQLDFCCGGKKSLEDACSHQKLNLNEIIFELEQLVSSDFKEEDWRTKPLASIIDFITEFYHDRLRLMLPELVALADKVEKVHADHPQCPKGLTLKLQVINSELNDHMMKEEQILFPMIKANQGPMTQMPINVMQDEHVLHGENLQQLRSLAFNYKLPVEACGTWRALYKGLDQLEQELMEHIHLENNILFVRGQTE